MRIFIAILMGCLLTACTTTPKEKSPYEEKIQSYPIQSINGKRVRLIPAEDYLLFRDIPVPNAPTTQGTSIIVDTQNQRTWLYQNGIHILTSSICPGKDGNETPKGRFRVIAKHRDWISTIYHVPMPFFLRLNAMGGRVGLHQGTIALQPASHGCIRLPSTSAQAFFEATPIGTPVIIQ